MAATDKQKTAVSKAAPKPFKRKATDSKHDGPLAGTKKSRSNAAKPDGAHDTEREVTAALQDQRAKKRRRQEGTQKAISKWEAIRRHDTDPKQRATLVAEVMKENAGSLQRLAASPVGSRVLQSCVKHGSAEQRKQILQELTPQLLELSKSPYAYHVVCKLVDTASKGDVDGLMKVFSGQAVKMLRHPCGSRVINELYTAASTKQRRALTAEFYGRETALFQKEAPQGLQEVLKQTDATGRMRIIQQMSINIIPIVEKGLLDPVITHGLVRDYMDAAPASAVADMAEMLAGPNILHMVHSHAGAHVACHVLALGTAKQRKKVIKAMKGHVKVMSEDEWAHIVLLAALSFTDDTALLKKSIVPELLTATEALCSHKAARHIALHLLAPSAKRYLPAHAAAMLRPAASAAPAGKAGAEAAPRHSKAAAGTSDDDEDIGENPDEGKGAEAAAGASKKDPTVRRREILGQGTESLGHALAEAAAGSAAALLQSPLGNEVLVEVACGGETGVLAELDAAGVAAAQDAIVQAVQAQPAPEDDEAPAASHTLLEHFVASRALRRLLLRGKGCSPDAKQAQAFADKLWTKRLQGHCNQFVAGHAAKVLAAVYQGGSTSLQAAMACEVEPLLPKGTSVDAWAAGLADKEPSRKTKPARSNM